MNVMLKDYNVKFTQKNTEEKNNDQEPTPIIESVSTVEVLEVGKMFCDKYSCVFKELAK